MQFRAIRLVFFLILIDRSRLFLSAVIFVISRKNSFSFCARLSYYLACARSYIMNRSVMLHRRGRMSAMHCTTVTDRLDRWLRCRRLYLSFVCMNIIRTWQLLENNLWASTIDFTKIRAIHKFEICLLV